jgi:hypothetical protein
VAAFLALPRMPRDAASALAEAEGLVTHLTSLVVLDEAGEVQDGLPAQRRVGVMTPRTQVRDDFWPTLTIRRLYLRTDFPDRSELADEPFDEATDADDLRAPLVACRGRIDWASRPEALRQGDLSQVRRWVARVVQLAASDPDVIALATTLGLPPVVLVLAMLADSERDTSRAAGVSLDDAAKPRTGLREVGKAVSRRTTRIARSGETGAPGMPRASVLVCIPALASRRLGGYRRRSTRAWMLDSFVRTTTEGRGTLVARDPTTSAAAVLDRVGATLRQPSLDLEPVPQSR